MIAITKREQVAQIFGKPIFVITDIALIPLSSRHEADQAISAVHTANLAIAGSDDFDYSDSEDEKQDEHVTDLPPPTPLEDEGLFQQRNASNTSIAEDVARRKAPYGKFASEWFSKKVWGPAKTQDQQSKSSSEESNLSRDDSNTPTMTTEVASDVNETNSETPKETAEKQEIEPKTTAVPTYSSTMSLLPKILRSVKMILSSHSYYFSYDIDLTRRLAVQGGRPQTPSRDKLDPTVYLVLHFNRPLS